MHLGRVVALDEVRLVAVALHQGGELLARDAGEDRGVGDLVAVEVEDRQDGAIADGVEELVRVPAGRQRPGLRLAVADDRADQQVRVVERGAVRVREGVAQFTALVDGARGLRGDVARDAAGEGELAEQLADAVLVAGDARIDLAVGPLEVGVGDRRRTTVAGTDDVDRVQVPVPDDPVHVDIDEVQARRRAPVAQQSRLDVLRLEGLPQERVVQQVDLSDRQVVRGPPVGVHPRQGVVIERGARAVGSRRRHRWHAVPPTRASAREPPPSTGPGDLDGRSR